MCAKSELNMHTLCNNCAIAPDTSGEGLSECAEGRGRRQHVPPDLTRMNIQRCGLALVCFSVFLSGLYQGTQNRIMRK